VTVPTGTAAGTERPLRVDAERNRQRILEAAARLFARRGLEVGLDEIARAAGVGTGTVYRRFPDKGALIDALVEDRAGAVLARAEQALAEPDAWAGLTGLLAWLVELQRADRGLRDAFAGDNCGPERFAGHHQRLMDLLTRLLEAARAQGELRPDVGIGDVAAALVMLDAAGEYAADADPDQWRRQFALLLDGFRTRRDGPTALPHGPLSRDDLGRLRTH
jgi:AcrR family transcriptional regulator